MGTTKPPKGKEWDKIVDEAFSSNELHTFSDNYRRRRAALERGVIMKKDDTMKRINPKSKRHYTGAAAIAAAVLLVPTVTIAGFRMSSGGKKSDPDQKALVNVETSGTEETTALLINAEDAELDENEADEKTESADSAANSLGKAASSMMMDAENEKEEDITGTYWLTGSNIGAAGETLGYGEDMKIKDMDFVKNAIHNYFSDIDYFEEAGCYFIDGTCVGAYVKYPDGYFGTYPFGLVTGEENANGSVGVKDCVERIEAKNSFFDEDEDLGEESTAAEDNGEAEDVAYSLLEAVDDHDVEYTFIPDGYETDGPYEGKFHKLGASGGITPCGLAKTSYFDKYIATFTDENAAPDINPEMLPRTADAPYEVITSDENTPDVEVYVFNRNVPDNLDENDRTAGYFNRDVVLRFKDTDYVEFMFVHSFVTQEELDSFIKGIKISPAINID